MKKAGLTLIFFLVYMVVGTGIAYIWTKADPATAGGDGAVFNPTPVVMGVSQLVSLVITTLLLWATRLIRRRPWSPASRLSGGLWGAAVAGFVLLSFGLSLLLAPIGLQDNGETALFDAMKGNVVCLFLLTVAGPLFEELVFREGILRHLTAAKVSPLIAALVSAMLFALVHGNWLQAVPAVALGFVLGLCYLRTGDIRLCGLLHIINNSMAVAFLCYPGIEAAVQGLPLSLQLVMGAVMAAAGAVLVGRVCRSVWRKA